MGEVPDDVLEVPVVLEDGQDVTGPLHLWEEASGDSDEVRLTLLYPGGKAEARGANFFRALQSIRRGLEPNGVRLRCLGACRDVYPSPMIEDMGPAEKAYRLTMGRPARTEDLVSIFSSGPDIDPASVDEQEAYYQHWLASLS
jgi:hypothetical protein